MAKEKKEKHFIKKPIYDGGLKAMRAFIGAQLRYPKLALEQQVEGTVYLKYTINHLGKVIDTKVISSVGAGCDEEAERIVRLLKFKVPKTRGIKVTFHKSIQIHFRLPKKKNKPKKKFDIVYKVTTTKTKKEQNIDRGYSYTIRL